MYFFIYFSIAGPPGKFEDRMEVPPLSRKMAALTPGFTGADIANMCKCNKAALIAARDAAECIVLKHFEATILERVVAGMEKTTNVLHAPA